MKIKELSKDENLVGLTIKLPKALRVKEGIPKGKMIIKSGWNKGLWLSTGKSDRIYPLFFDTFKDIEELEVIKS